MSATWRVCGPLAAAFLGGLLGCGGEKKCPDGQERSGETCVAVQVPDPVEPDPVEPEPFEVPHPLEAEAGCERVLGGGRSQVASALAWSHAHGEVRFFTGHPWGVVDDALADAAELGPPSEDWVSLYGGGLTDVCALKAFDGALPEAEVRLEDTVAWIRPGTGQPALPEGTLAVVIDLRDLPSYDGLEAALEYAASLAVSNPVQRRGASLLQHDGKTDQVTPQNVYAHLLANVTRPPIPARGQVDLPMAVVTSKALAPAAARLAGDLRLINRAWLFGEGVSAAAAESYWAPIGANGITWRAMNLHYPSGGRWPGAVRVS